jgi:hypothetical protein
MVKKPPNATVLLIYIFISTVFSKCLIHISMLLLKNSSSSASQIPLCRRILELKLP